MEEDRIKPKYTVSDVYTMTGITKAKLIDYDKKGLMPPLSPPQQQPQEPCHRLKVGMCWI